MQYVPVAEMVPLFFTSLLFASEVRTMDHILLPVRHWEYISKCFWGGEVPWDSVLTHPCWWRLWSLDAASPSSLWLRVGWMEMRRVIKVELCVCLCGICVWVCVCGSTSDTRRCAWDTANRIRWIYWLVLKVVCVHSPPHPDSGKFISFSVVSYSVTG